jgi:hypothetical protein
MGVYDEPKPYRSRRTANWVVAMTMAIASWKSPRQKGIVATAASLARWTAFEARS